MNRDLLINAILIVVSLGLFTRGFLLMRLEVEEKSDVCLDQDDRTLQYECLKLSPPKFQYGKLVIIIIDALRYDFAKYYDEPESKYFHNKMPVFHNLIEEHGCTKARLFRFWADSPTTTMQRIKGLTTGSLPTFIDLSKNFASSEITEDNFIDQFKANNRNLTFMGDDTWTKLYPGRFNKLFPFPSFDVKDLHTVDNGILEHFERELKNDDWQMFIAHFLGVDHCGHRYGPYHPEMTLKLNQMNDVIKNAIKIITNDTLLLVMGDHGMTHTGDHGGETFDELNAALFAYSPVSGFKACVADSTTDVRVDQVDIVPTISYLFGTSVPFANLGIAVKGMLPYDITGDSSSFLESSIKTTEALYLNAKQVFRYISTYQAISRSFPSEIFDKLSKEFLVLQTLFDKGEDVTYKCKSFLSSAREMCRDVWAKFDVVSMLSGISIMLILVAVNVSVLNMQKMPLLNAIAISLTFCTAIPLVISQFATSPLNSVFSLLLCCACFLTALASTLYNLWKNFDTSTVLETMLPSILLFAYSVSFTTNSFILNEDITSMYLLNSAIACLAVTIFFHSDEKKISTAEKKTTNEHSEEAVAETVLSTKLPAQRRKKARNNVITSKKDPETEPGRMWVSLTQRIKLLLLCVATLTCIRISISLRMCRAEQFWCFADESLSEKNIFGGNNSAMLLLSCAYMAACVLLPMWYMKINGNLKNSYSLSVCLLKNLLPMCVLCIAVSWVLLVMPSNMAGKILPSWCSTIFPRIVFVAVSLFLLAHLLNPVYTHILYPDGLGGYNTKPMSAQVFSQNASIPQMYRSLIKRYRQAGNNNALNSASGGPSGTEKQSPIAFGLYTLFTASTLAVMLSAIVVTGLLLGPERSRSILPWIVATAGVLEMSAVLMQQKSTLCVPWCSVVIWGMISSFWWFATGHQASISSINWDPAFVGFEGNHLSPLIPAALITISTYSSQILSTMSLPLLMFWPITRGGWYFLEENTEKPNSEIIYYKETDRFNAVLSNLYVKNFTFHIVKVIGCMVCACLHRRHLMVWQIFAPRFIFEGVSLLVILVTSIISFTLVKHTGKRIGIWLNDVECSLE